MMTREEKIDWLCRLRSDLDVWIPEKNKYKKMYKQVLSEVIEALSESTTITENMTNGDVIKAMFPNAEIYPFYTNTTELIVDINLHKRDASIRCTEDWLNKPYCRNEIIDKHLGKE